MVSIVFCIQLFSNPAIAQIQDEEPVADAKADVKMTVEELRSKACGSESVNFKASTDKKQHPTPEAPTDKAMIYVLRPTMIGFKIHSKLAVDGKWIGVNRGKTYFFFTLEKPGKTVQAKKKLKGELTADVS